MPAPFANGPDSTIWQGARPDASIRSEAEARCAPNRKGMRPCGAAAIYSAKLSGALRYPSRERAPALWRGTCALAQRRFLAAADRASLGVFGPEDFLQHLPLDRLLQDRHLAESIVHRVSLEAGDEDEGNATRRQNLGDWIGHPV